MDDRIRLAEAMWKKWDYPMDRSQPYFEKPSREIIALEKFDPFTDANDDYAVMEWMRQDYVQPDRKIFKQPPGDLLSNSRWTYKVGDYARTALKVVRSVPNTYPDLIDDPEGRN